VLVLGLALMSSVVATYVAAGMTDVPVAAASTATAALLWNARPGSARLALIALGAAATVLAKPTGLVALAGIGLALLVHARLRESRGGAVRSLAAVCAGTLVGLVYDAIEAHRIGQSLTTFLKAGNTDYFLARGAHNRWDRLLAADWLGAAPRLAVLLGILYALGRVTGLGARRSLLVAGPLAIAWSIAGPAIADGGTPYPFHAPLGAGLLLWIVLAAAILAALLRTPVDPVPRETYAMLLVWLVPGLVAWLSFRSDEVRFLSPIWAPLLLLAGLGLAAVAGALGRGVRVAALVPVAAVLVLALLNVWSLDGLGRQGWRGLLDLGRSGWGSKAAVENYAYGPFSYELDLARANVGPGQRIVSGDGRLTYFFPGRVEVEYPRSCEELTSYRYFALLTGGESAQIAQQLVGAPSDPLAWTQCKSPALHMVGFQDGIWAAFVVGAPTRASTADDCHVVQQPGSLFDAVFADEVDYATARDVQARAAAVGFGAAHVERTSCAAYRVVVSGIPEARAAQADFRREATGAGFRVGIVPAVRYPEVPADVAPAPASR
jgi:hypothetical protein